MFYWCLVFIEICINRRVDWKWRTRCCLFLLLACLWCNSLLSYSADTCSFFSQLLGWTRRLTSYNWKRSSGRPRQTWPCIIEKDLSVLSISLHTAWKQAQDQELWQRAVAVLLLLILLYRYWSDVMSCTVQQCVTDTTMLLLDTVSHTYS